VSLGLCDNHRGLSPGVWKPQVQKDVQDPNHG
jgi:hypothetical protein